MPQVINENPGIGALFASGLGQGLNQSLGTGLQTLAQHRLNQMLYGSQNAALSNALESLVGQGEESASPEQQYVQGNVAPEQIQLMQQQAPKTAAEFMSLLQSNNKEQRSPFLNNFAQQGQNNATQQQASPEAPKLGGNITVPKNVNPPSNKKKFSELLKSPLIPIDQKLKLVAFEQKQRLEGQKQSLAEKHKIDKETLPAYQEIVKSGSAAEANNKRLDKMEKLLTKGNLNNPLFASLLDTVSKGIFGFGLDVNFLLNADSQEFKKLTSDFIKDAKEVFGGRITDADLKSFLQTVPSLSQTDEGKMRVIRNLKEANNIALVKKRIAQDIIKNNGGSRPYNFESLVDELSDPYIKRIAQEFKNMGSYKAIPNSIFSGEHKVLEPGQSYNPVTGEIS